MSRRMKKLVICVNDRDNWSSEAGLTRLIAFDERSDMRTLSFDSAMVEALMSQCPARAKFSPALSAVKPLQH
jgi:hypothetical protein